MVNTMDSSQYVVRELKSRPFTHHYCHGRTPIVMKDSLKKEKKETPRLLNYKFSNLVTDLIFERYGQ